MSAAGWLEALMADPRHCRVAGTPRPQIEVAYDVADLPHVEELETIEEQHYSQTTPYPCMSFFLYAAGLQEPECTQWDAVASTIALAARLPESMKSGLGRGNDPLREAKAPAIEAWRALQNFNPGLDIGDALEPFAVGTAVRLAARARLPAPIRSGLAMIFALMLRDSGFFESNDVPHFTEAMPLLKTGWGVVSVNEDSSLTISRGKAALFAGDESAEIIDATHVCFASMVSLWHWVAFRLAQPDPYPIPETTPLEAACLDRARVLVCGSAGTSWTPGRMPLDWHVLASEPSWKPQGPLLRLGPAKPSYDPRAYDMNTYVSNHKRGRPGGDIEDVLLAGPPCTAGMMRRTMDDRQAYLGHGERLFVMMIAFKLGYTGDEVREFLHRHLVENGPKSERQFRTEEYLSQSHVTEEAVLKEGRWPHSCNTVRRNGWCPFGSNEECTAAGPNGRLYKSPISYIFARQRNQRRRPGPQ